MTSLLPIVLFVAGIFYWVGWILWGVFLLHSRHAPSSEFRSTLRQRAGRMVLGAIGLVIFLLTFTEMPFYNNSLMHFFNIDPFRTAP